MDQASISEHGVPGYSLMQRAGRFAFEAAYERWPAAKTWLVLCGAGNNAGDGYVIATLARAAGLAVDLVAIKPPQSLGGDAASAWRDFHRAGGEVKEFDGSLCDSADVIVDALLGTGLDRAVAGAYQDAVEAVNASKAKVVAVDVPSGINGDTGAVMGAAVQADLTASFVGRKQGLYLGSGPDYCGHVVFSDLDIPVAVRKQAKATLAIYHEDQLCRLLRARPATAHKGLYGHVLVIGGNRGMPGAVRLAGEAALRGGAGLVTVATRPENIAAVVGQRPELMCVGIEQLDDLDPVLAKATVLALGPGLGCDDWAMALLNRVLPVPVPKVLDADALNLLADEPRRQNDWILTPHPGEAARLLGKETAELQADRLAGLQELVDRYGGTVVLKGRGSLIGDRQTLPWLIDAGNPGMAVAGMGDVLTGLAAGLWAQFPEQPLDCAAAAAFVHARAGDAAAAQGERGLIPTDLLAQLRPCLNPRV